ncbi:hypothetical protein DPMN_072715 [Dreissena polymorpha]|uniref:Uncharacterized protein n=1 Tax=Dreissena polymorpha TaxID=45954 RepID=A0A9D4BXS6_DREPO|nr:hypothetical protein DPMN_072715 [Dreissena polymorpha]
MAGCDIGASTSAAMAGCDIGAATSAAMAGCEFETIKKAGRWRSDAYLVYLKHESVYTLPQLS